MVRRKHCHGIRGGRSRDAEEPVQDRGRGPAILGLNEDVPSRHISQERPIEALVCARDDREDPVGMNGQRGPQASPIQQRLTSQECAELLGPVVPRDPDGQRAQSCSRATGKDHAPTLPPGRFRRFHRAPQHRRLRI